MIMTLFYQKTEKLQAIMHAFLKTLDYFVGLFSRRTMRLFQIHSFCSQLGNIRLLLNKKRKKS